jgi:thiol-disulfide isomerase/thioredoxin
MPASFGHGVVVLGPRDRYRTTPDERIAASSDRRSPAWPRSSLPKLRTITERAFESAQPGSDFPKAPDLGIFSFFESWGSLIMRFFRGGACLLLCLLAGCEMGVDSAPAPQAPAPTVSAEPASHPNVARGLLRFNDGFQQGLAEADRDNKPMLLFFTAKWCQYCHQMAAEAFTNPQVVGLSEKFVCVLVDADSQPEICRQFHVSAFPTVQFVSPQGFLLNRIEGKRPGHQVMMAMQSALQTAALRNQPKASTLR